MIHRRKPIKGTEKCIQHYQSPHHDTELLRIEALRATLTSFVHILMTTKVWHRMIKNCTPRLSLIGNT